MGTSTHSVLSLLASENSGPTLHALSASEKLLSMRWPHQRHAALAEASAHVGAAGGSKHHAKHLLLRERLQKVEATLRVRSCPILMVNTDSWRFPAPLCMLCAVFNASCIQIDQHKLPFPYLFKYCLRSRLVPCLALIHDGAISTQGYAVSSREAVEASQHSIAAFSKKQNELAINKLRSFPDWGRRSIRLSICLVIFGLIGHGGEVEHCILHA